MDIKKRKFLIQLAIFATMLGTVGIVLKNDLTLVEKIFIFITAYNATLGFSIKLELMEDEND